MSFEGYIERLCRNGHYDSYGVYDYDAPRKCEVCQAPWVWTNTVDCTNGPAEGKVELEIDKQAVVETCKCCGSTKVLEEETYKIPADPPMPPCAVPGCENISEYDSPDYWCQHHWKTWFNWEGTEDEEPTWMKIDDVDELR